jgi:hypothetical protein
MAGEGDVQTDMKAHEKSFALFSGIMKWGTIVSLVAAAVVVLLIAS